MTAGPCACFSALNRFAFFLGGGRLLAFPPRSVTLRRAAKSPVDSAFRAGYSYSLYVGGDAVVAKPIIKII